MRLNTEATFCGSGTFLQSCWRWCHRSCTGGRQPMQGAASWSPCWRVTQRLTGSPSRRCCWALCLRASASHPSTRQMRTPAQRAAWPLRGKTMVDNPLIFSNDQSLIIAQPCRDCQKNIVQDLHSSTRKVHSLAQTAAHICTRGVCRKAEGLLTSG